MLSWIGLRQQNETTNIVHVYIVKNANTHTNNRKRKEETRNHFYANCAIQSNNFLTSITANVKRIFMVCMCLCLCIYICAEKQAHVCVRACLCCRGLWHNVNAAKMNAVTFIECAEKEKKMPKAATWPSKACTIFCDCFEMIKMPFEIEQVAIIQKCAAHFSNFLKNKIHFSLEFLVFVFLSQSIDVFFFQFSFVLKKCNNKKMKNFKWTCMEVDTQENLL